MKGIDENMIRQCRNSDERALHELYCQCYSLMKSICMRYVFERSDVPDVINRSFVKIVKGLDRYDIEQPFAPWITTIVIHEALDYVRKVMRERPKRPQLMEDMTICMSDHHDWNMADRNFDAESLLATLELLPPKTKTVFNLFAIDGYSHIEIGKQLNISSGTSKWHVSKAREILQAAVLKLNNEEQILS